MVIIKLSALSEGGSPSRIPAAISARNLAAMFLLYR